MNKIIEKLLFTEDKFMLELHLKQPEFNYSACAPFTNHSERIRNFRETANLKHLYRSKLDKVCFAHDSAYSDSKVLSKTAISDKILKDRAYEIGRDRSYEGYQRAIPSMVYEFFDQKKTRSGARATSKED